MPFKMKVIVLGIFATSFSWPAFTLTFNQADACIIGGGSVSIDVKAWAAASVRILAIFAWKQTFYSIFKEPNSALINKSVRIMWI